MSTSDTSVTTGVRMNAATLDEILPDAMRDEQSWSRLLQQLGAVEIRASLVRLRADVKQQRSINSAKAATGEMTRLAFNQWHARAAGFERALIRRLTQLQVNPGSPAANRTPEQGSKYFRRRHKDDVRTIEALAMAIHRYLEDDELDEDVLEDALDLTCDFGPHGQMSLADAIEQELIPSGGQGTAQ